MASVTYVGMDVHKAHISVAVLKPRRKTPIEFQIPHDPKGLRVLVRKLQGNGTGRVSCCYEAGPTGYALQRHLRGVGVDCAVIAPALIPKKPGDRVKTDRRDALKLAELWRAGLLSEVHPPTAAEEAVRDLTRSWETLRQDVTRAQHRVAKLLMRQGKLYQDGKKSWTWRYRTWLRSLTFDEPATRAVFADWMLALEHAEERLKTRAAELEAIAAEEPYRRPVAWLRCFYGIDTTAALMLVAELYHVARFISPRHLMSWVGLVPSEYSSGARAQRGGITKAGNRHVRWILCEIAHHYRQVPRVGRSLKKRRPTPTRRTNACIAAAAICGAPASTTTRS